MAAEKNAEMDPATQDRLDEELGELANKAGGAGSPILVAFISRLRDDPRLKSEQGRQEAATIIAGAVVLGVSRAEHEIVMRCVRVLLPALALNCAERKP